MKSITPALIAPNLVSTWGSCRTIIPNLAKAYVASFGKNLLEFGFGRASSGFDALTTAQAIYHANPSHLVFIDHERHPHDLLAALHRVYGRKKWPELVFHVFGDFTLYTPQWASSVGLLRGRQVQIVCASTRQCNLLASWVQTPKNRVQRCPFPVEKNDFQFVPGLRSKARERMKFSDGDLVIAYTGRLSMQKNVIGLLQRVVAECNARKISFRLVFAGLFDDMGSPFFGLRTPPETYAHNFHKALNELPLAARACVSYVGHLGKSELRELYHAADLFISLSTHHDEDYGMSPIEALACGVPAILSDWGGYSDFAFDGSCQLLPVKIGASGPRVEVPRLGKLIESFYLQSPNENESTRAERSRIYLAQFGTERAARIVNDLLRQPAPLFRGFTRELYRHAHLKEDMQKRGYMFKLGRRCDDNYRRFYRYYCESSKRT